MTDQKIVPSLIEGEPRVRDLDLAARLGFARPVKVRDLIKRHSASLTALGTLPTVGRVIRGGDAVEYHLNKKQAIFLTAKSETAKAIEITIEIIERFDAYERGLRPQAVRVADLTLAEFMALPLDERRERRLMIELTGGAIGPRSAHGMFERTVCRVSELGSSAERHASLFDDGGHPALDRLPINPLGETH